MLYSRNTLPHHENPNLAKLWRIIENLFRVRFQVEPIAEETRKFILEWRKPNTLCFDLFEQTAQYCMHNRVTGTPEAAREEVESLCMSMKERQGREPNVFVIEYFLKQAVRFLEKQETIPEKD